MSQRSLIDKLSRATNSVEIRLKKSLDPISRAQEAAKKAQQEGREPPEPPKIDADKIKKEVVKVDSEEKGRAIWLYLNEFVFSRIKKIENRLASVENTAKRLDATTSRLNNNTSNLFSRFRNLQSQVDFLTTISPVAYGSYQTAGDNAQNFNYINAFNSTVRFRSPGNFSPHVEFNQPFSDTQYTALVSVNTGGASQAWQIDNIKETGGMQINVVRDFGASISLIDQDSQITTVSWACFALNI